jgi:hypothetical protein
MIKGVAMIAMMGGSIVLSAAIIIAIFSGLAIASNLDRANCSSVMIDDTYITQTSDGFFGIETHYFVTNSGVSYELETNKNITSIWMWNNIERGSIRRIRTSDGYFVFCDQPKFVTWVNAGVSTP